MFSQENTLIRSFTMNTYKYILLFAVVANPYYCDAGLLPTYVDKCCLDDTLNDCIMESANKALKSVALGDGFYNTPGFFPLRIPKVEVLNNNNGRFTVSNVRIYGFPLGSIVSINVDIATATYHARYNFEKLVIEANYDIYLPFTPVSGFGSAEITLRNATVDHSFKVQVDNAGYGRIRNPKANYTVQSTTYKMDNMEASTNEYMNTHANNLDVLFNPEVSKAFSDVLSWAYIAIGDMVKLTDVIDFSCPESTTPITTTAHTCLLLLC